MRKWVIITLLAAITLVFVSFTKQEQELSAAKLRKLYSLSPDKWLKPFIDAGVQWKELGMLPESPVEKQKDSLKQVIELGKMLFFDTRLSGSGKISCATCHQPELNWTDGKEKSIGHEGAVNKRNSPSIQNSWFYNRLFWDGRSKDLQDQAFAPINSESEMHSEMHEVMHKLSRSKGYKEMFTNAFGDDEINPFLMTEAIATFEKTIISGTSRFDDFLAGEKNALTNSELRGLHLFRTKARCMNCHNGPLFSDNQFHNSGFSGGDAGYYNVTHKDIDKGKFKTPSLRDVARTGPWMHDGQFNDLGQIISRYSLAKFPPGEADALLQNLGLNSKEQKDLLAFLKAISAAPRVFTKPILLQ
ncbi:MAG: cytochrome-c peroxidase [Chitinophagaceae bacterium]|nr:cytochrome-c peroxidase [Chitinophagaceae bacterium]